MNIPAAVMPAIWGAVAGAVVAMVIGFTWAGWVTGGTAERMMLTSAEDAVVLSLTPLCVAKAEQEPEQLAQLKETSRWQRRNFVIEAGWVDNVNETYRSEVATECASVAVAAME